MLKTNNSDPLFQRCLVDVVRENPSLFDPAAAPAALGPAPEWSGLPVIFDEVFTGLYRLGRRTAASFLGVDPDIAVNAKLLTGGLVPLCTTVASQAIFDAFSSADKSDALLHGHSYTAHAVGCQVGVEALRRMDAMAQGGQWADHRRRWQEQSTASTSGPSDIWSVWSPDVIRRLSQAESVEGVWALGTVLVMSLRDAQGGGKFPPTIQNQDAQTIDNDTDCSRLHVHGGPGAAAAAGAPAGALAGVGQRGVCDGEPDDGPGD